MYCNYINQSMNEQKKRYMKVTGVGAVKAIPDTAIVSLGVISENISLEAARRENAVKSAAVINMLTSMGIESKQISTGAFSIDPLYDYIDGKQTFMGYRVSNLLTVIIKDIARAGEVIDNATFAGANRVDNISFILSDQGAYYDAALLLAVENAVHIGAELADALKVEIDEVPYRIIERSVGAPTSEFSVAKLSAAATPIMPGQLEIRAAVEVIFGY